MRCRISANSPYEDRRREALYRVLGKLTGSLGGRKDRLELLTPSPSSPTLRAAATPAIVAHVSARDAAQQKKLLLGNAFEFLA